MKKLFLFAMMALLLVPTMSMAQGVTEGDYPLSNHWNFDVKTIQLSFLELREGAQSGSLAASPLVAVGGGCTFYWGNKAVRPEYDAVIAFNVPALFVKTDLEGNYSVMPAAGVGLLDNRACFFVGYDTAPLEDESRSRWTLLVSLGIDLGN